MVRPNDLVVSLYDVDRDDTLLVGGKGANLGEMISQGFPVPPGFVITAASYFQFLRENELTEKIKHLLSSINFERDESISQVSSHIQKLIRNADVSKNLVLEIYDAYKKIGSPYVAIRSSATSEDSKTASFAGQNETFLNIKGEAVLAQKIKDAWASLFEPRSIFYRNEKKISHMRTGIALIVQKMIESEVSGVMFTVDPLSQDKSKIVIEAIFGLGELIVQGKVTPDHYEVDKRSFNIMHKSVSEQYIMLRRTGNTNRETKVPQAMQKKQKLSDENIVALAKLGTQIEKHYYFPQDIEWAKDRRQIYVVQTRPVTTRPQPKLNDKWRPEAGKSKPKLLLIGDPASPGIGVGKVRKVKNPTESGKLERGEVLVAESTSPDYVPAMRRASGIVTERGGRTSHAAIVAREFGIPAVVGVPDALSKLTSGQVVTVSGGTGEIFDGAYAKGRTEVDEYSNIKTSTKIFVNISEPDLAEKVARRNVDGVGLLRAEFMIAQIGVHPKKLIYDGKTNILVDSLSEGVAKICKAFYPRPVFYRATDFKTNEYRNLKGGRQYEQAEENPMIGFRGAVRYINDPQVFRLELKVVKYVREKLKLNNLNMMIPFVRTVQELEKVKELVYREGLRRSSTFKLYLMVEVPSNVILIDNFIDAGIDGISIGSNDLTMLILGVDRENPEISHLFDERNKAVIWAFERVIKAANSAKIPVSICGQAPSVFPKLTEELIRLGINSISVSRDAIEDTRRIVYSEETRHA